jgi:hypothetical protein
MPSPILNQRAVVMCPHGGQAQFVPSNPMVLVGGAPVLVLGDATLIAGCAFNIAGAPAPCVSIAWTMPAISVMVNNRPVLLQTSMGMCAGGSGAVPAIIAFPGQVQVMGT